MINMNMVLIFKLLTVSTFVYMVGDRELGSTLAGCLFVAPVHCTYRPVEMTVLVGIAFVTEFLLFD